MAPAGVSEQHDLDKIRPAQLRLVVSDMDGTLLDPVTGEVPEEFWPVLAQLQERGIDFVPASGRQYATLARSFADHLAGLHIIADNGAYVVHDQAESSSSGLDWEVSRRIVTTGRELIASGARAATVISRLSLENIAERFLSCAPLRCMIFLNLEWPAMDTPERVAFSGASTGRVPVSCS